MLRWRQSFLSKYDHVIFDCDGVLYRGTKAVPGAGQVVSSLLEAKKTVLYLTNAAPKCRTEVSKKLEKLGIPSTPTMCVPSCFLAARALADISERTPGAFDKKQHVAFVIGTGTGILVELNKVGISTLHADDVFKGRPVMTDVELLQIEVDPRVRAVVVGQDYAMSVPKLNYAMQCLTNPDVHFIGTNRADTTFPSEGGRLLAGGGSVIRWVECASGRACIDVGKPQAHIFSMLAAAHGLRRERTLMVGDRLNSDILFGQQAGIDTLLVLSGVTSIAEAQAPDNSIVPTYVAEDVNCLLSAPGSPTRASL